MTLIEYKQEIIYSKQLTPKSKLVILFLLEIKKEDGIAFFIHKYKRNIVYIHYDYNLKEFTGLSHNQIITAINNIKNSGFLLIKKRWWKNHSCDFYVFPYFKTNNKGGDYV